MDFFVPSVIAIPESYPLSAVFRTSTGTAYKRPYFAVVETRLSLKNQLDYV